jgi:hypothetical protein
MKKKPKIKKTRHSHKIIDAYGVKPIGKEFKGKVSFGDPYAEYGTFEMKPLGDLGKE